MEERVPQTAAEMERRYLMSHIRDEMEAEMKQYEQFIEKTVQRE